MWEKENETEAARHGEEWSFVESLYLEQFPSHSVVEQPVNHHFHFRACQAVSLDARHAAQSHAIISGSKVQTLNTGRSQHVYFQHDTNELWGASRVQANGDAMLTFGAKTPSLESKRELCQQPCQNSGQNLKMRAQQAKRRGKITPSAFLPLKMNGVKHFDADQVKVA